MKRISTISRGRVVEADTSQGLFLTLLEVVLNIAWEQVSEKGGKPQS